MSRQQRRRREGNAGAFYADRPMAVPIRTLSDDYRDAPMDPEDDREPEPEPPSLIHRVVVRLAQRSGRR